MHGQLDTKVLCINRNYVPIGVCSVRDSFKVVCKDHAHYLDAELIAYDMDSWMSLPVDDGQDSIVTPTKMIRVPRLLRINTFGKVPIEIVRFSRQAVFKRDGYICAYCEKKYGTQKLTLDHVIPKAQGGKKNWTNIVTACMICNGQKDDRTPEQAGLKLRRAPHAPTWKELVLSGTTIPYAEWEPFLSKS